jgi:mRNA-degrading endonuclease HigB of HigAB toxin-antitoxin module
MGFAQSGVGERADVIFALRALRGRVTFAAAGYRLVVATDFDKGIVWIKWIGTHKDYDKINVKGVQHGG